MFRRRGKDTHPLDTVSAGLGDRLSYASSSVLAGWALVLALALTVAVAATSFVAIAEACVSGQRASAASGVVSGTAPNRGVSVGGGDALCPGTGG